MSELSMGEWDNAVCEKLAETDRQIAAGTFETIPATKAQQLMEAHLARLREEENQEQQRRYKMTNPFVYVKPAF